MKNYIIYATAADAEEAEQISQKMVQQRVVACVNIINGVKSFYLWEGEVNTGQEMVLIMKTSKQSLKKARKLFCKLSSYDCPAFVAVKIKSGNEDFLNWIEDSTSITAKEL